MDKASLVKLLIDHGQNIVEEIHLTEPLKAAFWYRYPDVGAWRLLLELQDESKDYIDLMAVFGKVNAKRSVKLIMPDSIKLARRSDAMVRALHSIFHIENGVIDFKQNRIDGVLVGDAIIYKMMT